MYLDAPVEAQEWRPNALEDAEFQKLAAAGDWIGSSKDVLWQPLFSSIRKLEQAVIFPSDEAIKSLVDESDSGIEPLFINDLNSSSHGSCPGVGLDMEMLAPVYDTDRLPEHSVIGDICEAERQAVSIVQKLSRSNMDSSILRSAGWVDGGFRPGLTPRGTSSTLYFWAKVADLESGKVPGVFGLDSRRNICFAIRGTQATLQHHGLVDRFDSNISKNLSSTDGIETLEQQWQKGRAVLELGNRVGETMMEKEWSFFALSIDMERQRARFSVNGFVSGTDLEGSPEDWGCDSLDYILSSGVDMQISPVRVGGFALTGGSLQRLYLASRPKYMNIFTGEDRSRLERSARIQRVLKQFNSKMVGLSPPIVLQKRAGTNTSTNTCPGDTVVAVNRRLSRFQSDKCAPPYKCEEQVLRMVCPGGETDPPDQFFGQNPVVVDGDTYFPEFAWTLEGDIVVRNGEELVPVQDYIDINTLEIQMWMLFFVPSTQIATVFKASFDTSGIKITPDISYLQLKILEANEFSEILAWGIGGIAMSVLGALLALPAALKELSIFFRQRMRWFRKSVNKVMPAKSRFRSCKRRDYDDNTSQPDLLDVGLNLALMSLLVVFLINQWRNLRTAGDTFAEIADIEWDNEELSFDTKMNFFFKNLKSAMDLVEVEERFIMISFWMLIVCCIRLIIFMKLHPKIGSVSETFESRAGELLNFIFSFGVIYIFLGYIAHVRFGYLYDEFSTIEQSLITLFSILIGDTMPNYYDNTWMCIFIVGFVFICSFSLLNFLLAIVVNGYTQVTERVLENEVSQSVIADIVAVCWDLWLWYRHKSWPSKLSILSSMQEYFPDVFGQGDEVVYPLGRHKFHEVVCSASKNATPDDADKIFDHYLRLHVLILFKGTSSDDQDTFVAPARPPRPSLQLQKSMSRQTHERNASMRSFKMPVLQETSVRAFSGESQPTTGWL